MSQPQYKLYYYPLNASLAPHLVLEELAVDYDLVLVDRSKNAHKDAEYLALNPSGRIPTLLVDGKPLFESPAICMYLAEAHKEGGLAPEVGDLNRPEFLRWMMYLTNTFQAELMVYFYPQRHGGSGEISKQIIDAQHGRINAILEVLDRQLMGKGYLLGEQLTVCDYFLFMLCVWADEMPKPPMEFDNLSKYLCRLATSQTVQTVCEKEGISLEVYC